MNIIFWSLMLLMLLVATGIVIYPLLKKRPTSTLAYKDSNLRLYEDKIQELDIDLNDGRIDKEQYKSAREELDRELLNDIPPENRDTASVHYSATVKNHPALALGVAVFIPVLALLMYMQLGMHAAIDKKAGSEHAQLSVAEMVERLAEHLETSPGTVEEWAMLGRSYRHLGRFNDAARAFAVVVERNPSAQSMLEMAEALALGNDQRFNSEARSLVMKALELEPGNMNVLWFAGVAEFQTGNYRDAIDYLSRLSDVARTDNDVNQSIRMYIKEARQQLIARGEQVPDVDEILQVSETGSSSAATQIQVTVDISAQARSNFDSTDTVFIYAKAQQGPKMPLAATRVTLADLPTTVILDDNMAMVAGMNLSTFNSVMVSARVTKSGSAIAAPGDYIGEIAVDDVAKTSKASVTIDTVVP